MNKILEIALSQFGIREWVGKEHNPEVMKYFSETGFSNIPNDETSWCSAFMMWCIMKANLPHTNSLLAKSWLKWGIGVVEPELGDVVVFWRIDPNGPYGHVGLFIRKTNEFIWVLGGNQGNSVSISFYPVSQLLGYRRWV